MAKDCESCQECLYIGDGDYACMKDAPKIVLTDFNVITDDYGWCRREETTMQIIKVKFLKGDAPSGKAYTYYSPAAVSVGDKVQITETAVGVVVEVNVPEAEVAPYRDKLKTIVGLVETPSETYDPLAATEAQSRYCREHNVPRFAPKSGRCWRCEQNIFLPGKKFRSVTSRKMERTDRDSAGITVERAGREHITGCPHCGWSFCE